MGICAGLLAPDPAEIRMPQELQRKGAQGPAVVQLLRGEGGVGSDL